MHIEQFAPVADASRLRACFEMFEGAKPEDDPNGPPMSLPGFTGWWGPGWESHPRAPGGARARPPLSRPCFAGGGGLGWNSDPRETWLATDDGGAPAGCYLLELP